MQTMYAYLGGQQKRVSLPPADSEVLPGVLWGGFDELMTPAWWAGQCWQQELLGRYLDLKLGRNLTEELAACLLGGYGMPAELGLAAYNAVRSEGLLAQSSATSAGVIETLLSMPLPYGTGHRAYRFPRQKARYLSGCLHRLQTFEEPDSDRALRDSLATFPGVGLKTASWIVRNYRGSHAVAVLDVHILRAGRCIGLFPRHWQPQSHYAALESQFLAFAGAIQTKAGLLDAVMWDFMRRMPRAVVSPQALGSRLGLAPDDRGTQRQETLEQVERGDHLCTVDA